MRSRELAVSIGSLHDCSDIIVSRDRLFEMAWFRPKLAGSS